MPRTFDERTAIRQIDLIAGALQLSKQEIGRMFGDVSRQAVDHWLQSGVPIERAADIDRVAEVIRELARRFKPQRLPQIARRPMPILDGRSILEVLSMQGAAPMHEFFRRWDSYVPDVAPIREADFAK